MAHYIEPLLTPFLYGYSGWDLSASSSRCVIIIIVHIDIWPDVIFFFNHSHVSVIIIISLIIILLRRKIKKNENEKQKKSLNFQKSWFKTKSRKKSQYLIPDYDGEYGELIFFLLFKTFICIDICIATAIVMCFIIQLM
ncbi:hypothetical protein DERP_001153 [Dermatophagoides pteronyssinus]|uniref:Uncharacterized protein n=1 Tax=Dermatophagoides pteronyssinus TaxID=6956 RepID=A0ABQ8JE61_DERPT|nr:hypothetical protein DERP_001153 [Dermatophagoides pteronyssinus]